MAINAPRESTWLTLRDGMIEVEPVGTRGTPLRFRKEKDAVKAVAQAMVATGNEKMLHASVCDFPHEERRRRFNVSAFRDRVAIRVAEIRGPVTVGRFAISVEDKHGRLLPQYEFRGDIIDSAANRAVSEELQHEAYHCAVAWEKQGATIDGVDDRVVAWRMLRERALGAYLVSEHIQGRAENVAAAAYAMSQLRESPTFIVKATLMMEPTNSDRWLNCWEVCDLGAE